MRPRRIPADKALTKTGLGGAARLADVAQLARVSTATVSRCINQPSTVSVELRTRIDKAIKQLGWVPHAAARALVTQRTRTVGAIVPTLANENFARAIQVMQEALEQQGYTLLLACSEYDLSRELRQVQKLLERNVDALVLVGEAHPAVHKLLAARTLPVIHTFTYRAKSKALCVGVDNYRAMAHAVSHMIELGHRSFGMLVQDTEGNDRAQARWDAAVDTLAKHRLKMKARHVANGLYGVHLGRELFRKIMANPNDRPTALICANGSFAIGAIFEARVMGIDIPQQLSILGFDDFELMAALPTPLTSVRVPSAEIGMRTADFIMAHINGTPPPPTGEFEAELILRASIGPPPRGR
jgi:LacI family transcriptional regulator